MSRLFGPLRQMGFVVRDIDKAMRHWVEVCGVGPWYLDERLPLQGFWYKEQRCDGIHLTIALANSGDVQLELIQQRDDTPSMYRDFLAAGHEGLQHWSSWPENYHELLDRAVSGGWRIGRCCKNSISNKPRSPTPACSISPASNASKPFDLLARRFPIQGLRYFPVCRKSPL